MNLQPAPRWMVIAAYAVIYLVWGSTFLAIAVSLREVAAFPLIGSRFLMAGLILLVIDRLRGGAWVSRRDWLQALLIGGLMAAGGNGLMSFGMTKVASGVTSLVVATVPLWIVVLDAASRRQRPPTLAIVGLLAGMVGVVMLSTDGAAWTAGAAPGYMAIIVVGTLLWAIGSILSKRLGGEGSLGARTGSQMAAGGALLMVVSAIRGEGAELASLSVGTWAAWSYLIVFGSVLAYTCYLWLLRVSPASSVATYAFVNPLIAVALGVVFLDEVWSNRMALATALILGAVIALNLAGRAVATPAAAVADDAT